MRLHRLAIATLSTLLLTAGVGCAPQYAPPPPPPPNYAPPPLVQLAERNGFETGRSDGARDADHGFPFSARHTRAYHDTPGYDPHLGPFPVYRDAFRNAYLRGYDKGFYRR